MVINKVDVICEHKSDGSIIPLRFQILDEDGAYQRFNIKGYKLNEVDGAYTTKDCLYVSRGTNIYECKIDVLGYKKSTVCQNGQTVSDHFKLFIRQINSSLSNFLF